MKKRVLIILTSQFPYGRSETFLETEVDYYQGFDKVVCIPLKQQLHGQPRKTPKEMLVNKIEKKFESSKVNFHMQIAAEYFELVRQKRFSFERASIIMEWYAKALISLNGVERILEKQGIEKTDNIVIYSYWMDEGALVGVLLKRKYLDMRVVARCHGIDLYEEENRTEYLPFRKYLLKNLSHIYPISMDGKKYLQERYQVRKALISVRRLGTKKNSALEEGGDREYDRTVLKVLSCSALIPLKRVEKIVEILGNIKDIPIEWTHFGGGVDKGRIIKLCKEKLGNNVAYCIKGNVDNRLILQEYREKEFHVFMNMSRTEGIPVSFMEAMSYGIPVIATAVGGVPEIVKNGVSGFLLQKDIVTEEAIKILRYIQSMKNKDYKKLRLTTESMWSKNYNSDKNYKKFAAELLG